MTFGDRFQAALEDFIEHAPVGIFRTRSDGRIALANSAIVNMLKYPDLATFLEVKAADLCHDPRDGLLWLRELVKEGAVRYFETRLRCHDGSLVWVELHGRALKDEAGNLVYYEGVAVDITRRKLAESMMISLTQELEKSIEQTVYSIVNIMEKRDPYTAIHQRRAARLAATMAAEMGLGEERTRGLYIGSLIHDVGKFFIPLEYLCCPGPLGATEMELIRRHTRSGFEVVKDIESRWPIAEMVLQHHERLDGTGYPYGLGRADIGIESRILAVADTVEAMAEHRPYRPKLGVDAALEEIVAGRGARFESEAVDSCLRLFQEKSYLLGQGDDASDIADLLRLIAQ